MTHQRMNRQAGLTLIELLVAISIASVLSTMIIGTWITLTQSYSRTSTTAHQIEIAREGLSRMSREVRDAQSPMAGQAGGWGTGRNAILLANWKEIQYFTTFNVAGNNDPAAAPKLIRYQLVYDAALKSDTLVRTSSSDLAFGDADDERTIVTHGVNTVRSVPVFRYTYTTDSGALLTTGWMQSVPIALLRNIVAVQIDLLVDLNPGRSPEYSELKITCQPRNLRGL